MQSRRQSLAEALCNVLIGYWVAIGSQLVILPAFGYDVALRESMEIGMWFTVVSVARSYMLRRFFNWYHQRERNYGEG